MKGLQQFSEGEKVRPKQSKDRGVRIAIQIWTKDWPCRSFWQWLRLVPAPTFTVVSNRWQQPRCGIGGTYTTIRDNNGAEHEIPQCFLEHA